MAAQTFTIKAHIDCCSECPLMAKNKLQKIQGVDSVTMDREKGLVMVSGSVEPTVIIEKFAKWGKKAELWSFQKENMQDDDDYNSNCCNNEKKKKKKKKSCLLNGEADDNKDHHHVDGGWSIYSHSATPSRQDDKNNQTQITKRGKSLKKHVWSWLGRKIGLKSSNKSLGAAAANHASLSPNKWHFPRTPMQEFGPFRPFYGAQYRGPPPLMFRPPGVPPFYGLRPPPLLPYGIGPPAPAPPVVNPMIHYTSYEDNYRYF